jgi:hypothetical protein
MTRKELEKLLRDNFSEDEEVVFGYHDGFYGVHYSFGCRMECEDGAKTIILKDGGTGFEEDS